MNNPTRAIAIGLIFTALCITLALILSGCNDRETVHCNDGSTQSGTNVNPTYCNNHGGKAS